MSRKQVFGAALAVVVAGLAYYGYQRIAASRTAAAPLETAVVRRGTLVVTVEATGSLVPRSEVVLAFSSGGQVAEVLVEDGQQVGAGEAIARLDTGVLALQLAASESSLASAQAGLSTARSDLEELLAGPTARDVEIAQLKLSQAKDSRWSTQSRRDSTCGAVESGRGQQVDCDVANASVLQAESSVRLAELDYEALTAGPTTQETDAARDKVRQAESQVAGAETQLAQARLSLEEATLTAPLTGTVTALNIQPGTHVGGGQQVALLSDLANLEVDVNLDETDVARVAIGQEVQVVLDAFPGADVGGEVASIAPIAQVEAGVVLYPVTIRLLPTELALRVGMTADVTIVAASKDDALIVPLRAVRTVGGRSTVQRLASAGQSAPAGTPGALGRFPQTGTPQAADRRFAPGGQPPAGMTLQGDSPASGSALPMTGEAELVEVALGLTNDSEAEVVSGLSAGDVVAVTAPSSSSSDGFGPPPGGMGGIFRIGR